MEEDSIMAADTPDFIPDSTSMPDSPVSGSHPDFIPTDQFIPDKDYSTPSEMAKTAAEGVSSGLTFGLGRELESKLLNNAKEQKSRAEENPGLSSTGEYGSILAMPASGLVGAVSKLGKGVETLAKPLLGKLGAKAVGSAIEGSFYGAGNAVTEHALGDADLNAENLVHNMGYAGILGGGLGTALGLGSKVFSPKIEAAATKEMHLDNALKESPGVIPGSEPIPETAPQSTSELEARNKLANKMGFDTTLPVKDSLLEAQQNLAGDMTFLPHGAQIESLSNPENRLAYKMQLKSDTPIGQELRQYETNQKYEGSQKLIPEYIQDIAPDATLTSDAYEGGKKAIDSFKEAYEKQKAADAPAFEKLDSFKTNSVSNPEEILNGIYSDIPGARDLVSIRPDGDYFLKGWSGTSGVEKGTYSHLKEVVKALNKDALTVGDIRNLRDTMFDASKNWEKPTEAFQVSNLRKNLLDYMQDQVEKSAPDMQIRDFMKRYAINEQNRGIIENIFGGSFSDKAKFGKAIEPEKVLPRIFSSLEDVKAAKELLGDKWNETVADYLSHLHNIANDPISGFSSNKFSRSINDIKSNKNIIMNEALADNPEKLQKIRDVTTVMRSLPDSPPGNPSDTASASKLLSKARSWSGALFHPTQLLGHVADAISQKLDSNAERAALDRVLGARAEENFIAKAQKFNALGKIERAQQKTINEVRDTVSNILRGDKESAVKGILVKKLTKEDQQKKYDNISQKLKDMSANPQKFMDTMQQSTQDLHAIAPILATSLSTTMAKATQFLTSKLPATEPPSPGMQPYQPSQSELAKFNRYYDAIEKPIRVLKEVQAGVISPESIEALESVHPKLLSAMRQELLDQFSDMKDTASIPYKNKLAMSLFLNSDMTNSLKPANIMSAQINPGQQLPMQQQTQKAPSQKGLDKLKAPEHVLTPFQQSARSR